MTGQAGSAWPAIILASSWQCNWLLCYLLTQNGLLDVKRTNSNHLHLGLVDA